MSSLYPGAETLFADSSARCREFPSERQCAPTSAFLTRLVIVFLTRKPVYSRDNSSALAGSPFAAVVERTDCFGSFDDRGDFPSACFRARGDARHYPRRERNRQDVFRGIHPSPKSTPRIPDCVQRGHAHPAVGG